MSVIAEQSAVWPAPQGIAPLLDDHHLAVLCDDGAQRDRIGRSLKSHLRSTVDAQLIDIDGLTVIDVLSFAAQVGAQLHLTSAGRGVASAGASMPALVDLLRRASSGPRRRYFFWHEAQATLENDVDLFSKLVNALFCVSAECEHLTLDPVMIQRVIFLGGAKLGAYAEDTNGQFRRWLDDGRDGSPFWEIMSVVQRPAVITYRVEG